MARNPWLKKNPLLSIGLSMTNAAFGAARGQAAAASTRSRNAALRAGTKAATDMMSLTFGAAMGVTPAKKARAAARRKPARKRIRTR